MNTNMFLLTVALFAGVFAYTEACSCMESHPQEQFCRSDFVILARVKREKFFNDTRVYKVRVRKEYKVSEKGVLALKAGRLLTPKWESMCGIKLIPGQLYVISGRIFSLKAYINMCGMIRPWDSLSRRQRKGLKLLYKHGCSCDIRRCNLLKRGCYRQKDNCIWQSHCEAREGICLRQANQSCMWTKTRALAECIRDWRRSRNITSQHYDKKSMLLP